MWHWVRDLLVPQGIDLRLAHAKHLKAIRYAKVKSDAVDAATMAPLLRMQLIPEAHMIREGMRAILYDAAGPPYTRRLTSSRSRPECIRANTPENVLMSEGRARDAGRGALLLAHCLAGPLHLNKLHRAEARCGVEGVQEQIRHTRRSRR